MGSGGRYVSRSMLMKYLCVRNYACMVKGQTSACIQGCVEEYRQLPLTNLLTCTSAESAVNRGLETQSYFGRINL